MHEHAEVIRLESQLTVPTRNCAHLSDLWIAIAWSAGSTEWALEFAMVAEGHNVPVTGAGRVELVPMSDRQGWIVARGVDLALYSPADVEAIVRGLVAQINGAMTSPSVTAKPDRTAGKWSQMLRSAVQASGNAALGMVPDPRPRAEADAPSRS